MKLYPTITIITSTLNPNLEIFERVLISIKKQVYSGVIEHIVLDGGSHKSTINLAKSFGCKVLIIRSSKDEGGGRLYRGLQDASGDIILILQSDNMLPDNDWLVRMVEPFHDKRVFSTFSAYNSFLPSMPVITRYVALFGSPEPTLYYLGKSDKIPQFLTRYDKGKILSETKNYYIVSFKHDELPTMGDNGFMIKKAILKKVVKKNRSYIHLDAFFELLEMGYDTYGVVKNGVIHMMNPSILKHIMRRVNVKHEFYNKRFSKRKYLVYNPKSIRDRLALISYIFFSFTIIQPLFLSIRGYLFKRDIAWFLHPILCILMIIAYGCGEIELRLMRSIRR